MLTPKEKIEEMLTKYPYLKNKINTLNKIAGQDISVIKGMDYSQPTVGKTNNIYQEIEEYITNIVGSQQILDDLIMLVTCIEESMKMLTVNERYIIKCKYNFNGEELTEYEIVGELGYSSRTTIYRKHIKAIEKIKDNGLHKHYKTFKQLLKELE